MLQRFLLVAAALVAIPACSKAEKPTNGNEASDKNQKSSARDDDEGPELQPKAKKSDDPSGADPKDDLAVVEVSLVNTTDDRPIPVSRAQTHWLDEDIIARLPVGTKVTRQECRDYAKSAGAKLWRCKITFKKGSAMTDGWVHGSAVGKPNIVP